MPFPEFCRGSLVGLNWLRVNFSGLTASSLAGAGRGLTPGTERLCQVLPIKLRTRLRSLNRAALAQRHRVLPGLAFRVFTKPDRTPPKKVQPSSKQRRWPRGRHSWPGTAPSHQLWGGTGQIPPKLRVPRPQGSVPRPWCHRARPTWLAVASSWSVLGAIPGVLRLLRPRSPPAGLCAAPGMRAGGSPALSPSSSSSS